MSDKDFGKIVGMIKAAAENSSRIEIEFDDQEFNVEGYRVTVNGKTVVRACKEDDKS